MNYKHYQNVRDATWRMLLDCGVDRLPVNLNDLCRQLGIRVYRYEDVGGISRAALQGDGLLYYEKSLPVILFNQKKSPARIRFTIAHELGHLVLGHVIPEYKAEQNWRSKNEYAPIEMDANQFATRLLAPACVLWGVGVQTPEEISKLCNISKQAALVRAERMKVLYQRNQFLTSPLERQVYEQFLPFIREARQSRWGE